MTEDEHEEFLDNDDAKRLDPLDRAVGIASMRDLLQKCTRELDVLGAWQASAYVCMAISSLGES